MTSIVISEQGGMRFIWNDDLAPMLDLGKPKVERASRVEPDEKAQPRYGVARPIGATQRQSRLRPRRVARGSASAGVPAGAAVSKPRAYYNEFDPFAAAFITAFREAVSEQ